MNTQKGFTLLELVVVVAIVAILAVVVVPSYQSHIIKTRRAKATACLLEMSQLLERFHTVNMSYAKDKDGNAFVLPSTQCSNELAGYYTFGLANQTARTYLLSAIPQRQQESDDPASCGTLTINQAGQKGAGGSVSTCWK